MGISYRGSNLDINSCADPTHVHEQPVNCVTIGIALALRSPKSFLCTAVYEDLVTEAASSSVEAILELPVPLQCATLYMSAQSIRGKSAAGTALA